MALEPPTADRSCLVEDIEHDETWQKRGEALEGGNRAFPGPGLCFHCRNAWIRRTAAQNEPTIECTYSDENRQMPPNVIECNKYAKVGSLSLYEMGEIAKRVGEEVRQAGFMHTFALLKEPPIPPQEDTL